MRVVEETLGPEHLRRFLRFARLEYEIPRSPRLAAAAFGPPTRSSTTARVRLRCMPWASTSAKSGSAMHSGACSRNMVRERRPCRPRSTSIANCRPSRRTHSRYLLRDLFEANTFWELETETVTAEQTEADTWQVTLDVRARKVVVDESGVETAVPMNDSVEIGIFDDRRPERADLPAEAPRQRRQADPHCDRAAKARARRHRPALPPE